MLSIPRRFHFLDALRGFAALTVVCYHWKHFWISIVGWGNNIPAVWTPFYNPLSIFYKYEYVTGWMFEFKLKSAYYVFDALEIKSRRGFQGREVCGK